MQRFIAFIIWSLINHANDKWWKSLRKGSFSTGIRKKYSLYNIYNYISSNYVLVATDYNFKVDYYIFYHIIFKNSKDFL